MPLNKFPSFIFQPQQAWWKKLFQQPFVHAVLFLWTCVIAGFDYLTGTEISFSIFYLLPIVLATWLTGGRYGIVLSMLSAVLWFTVEYISGVRYTNPVVGYWNAIVRLGYFSITVLLLTKFKHSLQRQQALEREKHQELTNEIEHRKHLETSLQQTLSVLGATLDATSDGILVVDLQGNIQSYNKRFIELWKTPQTHIMTGKTLHSQDAALSQLKNSQVFLEKVKALNATPESESFDIIEFNDGRIFECESRPQRINEVTVGRVWCFRDVTIRKEAERVLLNLNEELERRVTERTMLLKEANIQLRQEMEARREVENALRASETRFRGLIENSADGISLVDENGTILYYSPSASRILGYSFEELRGKSAFEMIHPNDVNYIQQLHQELSKQPRASITSRHRARHKNGTWRWIEGTGYNLFDEPSVNAIVINFRDITERVRTEEQILLLAHALESTSEMISIVDLQNHFIFVNKAFIETYGYTKEEILGCEPHILSASTSEAFHFQKKIFDATRRGGWNGELLNRKKDGTVFPIQLATSPIYDAEKNIIGYIGVARDITEQKNAEQALLKAELRFKNLYDSITNESDGEDESTKPMITSEPLLIGDLANRINNVVTMMEKNLKRTLSFTSFASHELRIPLTIIRNQLEGILRPNTSTTVLRKSLISTYDEILRLSKIVEDLLNLATMQTGTTRFQLQPLDVSAFLKEFYEEALLLSRPKNVTFVLSHGPSVFIQGDALKLRQMLFNLLDNALHYTPEGGRIHLSYFTSENKLTFSFSDTGAGIPPEQIAMIFNPFYKGTPLSSARKGTGLGLAIVEWIVEGHNGTIHVESEVGKGTTFIITLPLLNNSSIPS